eukprot:Pgem_evm1s19908
MTQPGGCVSDINVITDSLENLNITVKRHEENGNGDCDEIDGNVGKGVHRIIDSSSDDDDDDDDDDDCDENEECDTGDDNINNNGNNNDNNNNTVTSTPQTSEELGDDGNSEKNTNNSTQKVIENKTQAQGSPKPKTKTNVKAAKKTKTRTLKKNFFNKSDESNTDSDTSKEGNGTDQKAQSQPSSQPTQQPTQQPTVPRPLINGQVPLTFDEYREYFQQKTKFEEEGPPNEVVFVSSLVYTNLISCLKTSRNNILHESRAEDFKLSQTQLYDYNVNFHDTNNEDNEEGSGTMTKSISDGVSGINNNKEKLGDAEKQCNRPASLVLTDGLNSGSITSLKRISTLTPSSPVPQQHSGRTPQSTSSSFASRSPRSSVRGKKKSLFSRFGFSGSKDSLNGGGSSDSLSYSNDSVNSGTSTTREVVALRALNHFQVNRVEEPILLEKSRTYGTKTWDVVLEKLSNAEVVDAIKAKANKRNSIISDSGDSSKGRHRRGKLSNNSEEHDSDGEPDLTLDRDRKEYQRGMKNWRKPNDQEKMIIRDELQRFKY